jgi:hypothetical protein
MLFNNAAVTVQGRWVVKFQQIVENISENNMKFRKFEFKYVANKILKYITNIALCF